MLNKNNLFTYLNYNLMIDVNNVFFFLFKEYNSLKMKTLNIFLLFVGMAVESFSYLNKVVDLSHWNTVDFNAAKSDGIIAVIHKATQGVTGVDKTYHSRKNTATSTGLLWGAYHFGTAAADGVQQANHFLSTVGNTAGVLLALDVEPNGSSTMTVEQARQFVDRIHAVTGRYPLLYGAKSFLTPYTQGSLAQCKLWIAHYTSADKPNTPSHWKDKWVLWQYTDGKDGGTPKTVRGIGKCDRDRYNGSEEDLRSLWPNL